MRAILAVMISVFLYACGQTVNSKNDRQVTKIAAQPDTLHNAYIPDNVLKQIKAYYLEKYGSYYSKDHSNGIRVVETDVDSIVQVIYENAGKDSSDYNGYIAAVYIPRKEHMVIAGMPGSGEIHPILYGDVNHDKTDDIVVSVHVECMDCGNDRDPQDIFVFLNKGGVYELSGVTPDNTVCGCQSGNSFHQRAIQDGYVIGESVCFSPGDDMCCPTLKQETKLKFSTNKLFFYGNVK